MRTQVAPGKWVEEEKNVEAPKVFVVEIPFKKQTPGALQFEDPEGWDARPVSGLYVRKMAQNGEGSSQWGKLPKAIKVTIEPVF